MLADILVVDSSESVATAPMGTGLELALELAQV